MEMIYYFIRQCSSYNIALSSTGLAIIMADGAVSLLLFFLCLCTVHDLQEIS